MYPDENGDEDDDRSPVDDQTKLAIAEEKKWVWEITFMPQTYLCRS